MNLMNAYSLLLLHQSCPTRQSGKRSSHRCRPSGDAEPPGYLERRRSRTGFPSLAPFRS
ncbi:protein of unknown function [Methylacidimicrobium sp. AP8]|nr:protein of unknown function [Methylacidimicrobium sp. AP8]